MKVADRFWAKVDKGSPNECWLWLGGRATGGYGVALHDGKRWQAHRLAWTLTYGPIPNGMLICHRHDNPSCCNPAHLFCGTQKDNVADAIAKGRMLRGEMNGKAKLTEHDVLEIRARSTEVQARLAEEFGVVRSHIGNILAGRYWKHLLVHGGAV